MAAGREPAHVHAGLGDRVSAEQRAQPGIDPACYSCSSYGASRASITVVIASMSPLSRSMRASILASSAASSAVKNSAPSRAASSSLILRRTRARARLSERPGVAFPGDQVVHDVPAGHPVQVADWDRRTAGCLVRLPCVSVASASPRGMWASAVP